MKLENGALDICLKKDPAGNWQDSAGDSFTGMQITGPEWRELYHVVLQVPDEFDLTNGKKEDIYTFYARQERSFRDFVSQKGYPMLSRIWDLYQDAVFFPVDVEDLKNECIRLRNATANELASSALQKLERACEQALSANSGVVLSGD